VKKRLAISGSFILTFLGDREPHEANERNLFFD